MEIMPYHWFGFNLFIVTLLVMDLWRFFYRPHQIKMKEALFTSIGWILLALFFNIWVYLTFGPKAALDFFTGYLLEKSLSIDNLFIFLILFAHFKVPDAAKHQVLFYGVLGAIIMRAILIWSGITLIQYFQWTFILFGLFLIITGVRLAFHTEEKNIDQNFIYSRLKKWIPLTDHYRAQAFIIREKGKWVATPLLVVLILIEVTDLVFALDSVPAILGITTEPFIVYTSNIFAILGLRSLFFALEGIMKAFYLLHYALAFILVFIGVKMMGASFFHISTWLTLVILSLSISIAIAASLLYPPVKTTKG